MHAATTGHGTSATGAGTGTDPNDPSIAQQVAAAIPGTAVSEPRLVCP